MADAQQSTSMLQNALEYLQLGYPVFPVCSPPMGQHRHGNAACKSAGKHPLVSWEAFQTRLPTINEIREWWTRWPLANIGMPTGRLSGVVVLDADSGDAKKLAMEQGGVDQTPAVFTGKPGGIHFWLAHPGEDVSNFARKRPGLDFRGDGGYVLVPPSRHASGASYRWVDGTANLQPATCPSWLLDLLRGHAPTGESEKQTDALDLDAILRGVPEGGRDDAMWRLACKLRNDNVERRYADLLVRQAALACTPAFDTDIALEKVARAYQQYEPEQTFVVTAEPGEHRPAGGEYQIQQVASLLDLQVTDEPCLVNGVIWANRVSWIFSDPNSGKTLFLFALLLHIAAGKPFCGNPVRQCPVLVIEEDSPLSVAAEYIEMLADIYGFDLLNLPFWINKSQGLRIMDAAGVQLVMDTINGCLQRPGVILFDACERLIPSDRFTTKELDPLTRLFQWCVSNQITPLMIDHTNKDRPKKGEAKITPMDKLYGARAKSAISDVMMFLSGSLKAGGTGVEYVKFRGEKPPSFSLGFDAVEGFTLKRERLQAQSPAEQKTMQFFNNMPAAFYGCVEVEVETAIPRRTQQRTLAVLVKRGWLITQGDGFDRKYRSNPEQGGLFS